MSGKKAVDIEVSIMDFSALEPVPDLREIAECSALKLIKNGTGVKLYTARSIGLIVVVTGPFRTVELEEKYLSQYLPKGADRPASKGVMRKAVIQGALGNHGWLEAQRALTGEI